MEFDSFAKKADTFGLILVFIIALAIIIIGVVYCIKLNSCDVLPEKIVIDLKSDSTKYVTYEDQKAFVDSLNQVMLSREKLLAVKYQDLIKKREFDENVIALSSVIISLIISILGFFGFKSFQSIKEESVKIAESKSKEYLDVNLNNSVKHLVEDSNYLKKISKIVTASFKESVIKKIEPDIDKIENLNSNINEIQAKLEELERKITIKEEYSELPSKEKGPSRREETLNIHYNDEDDENPFNNYSLRA